MLNKTIKKIKCLDESAIKKVQIRLDNLTKPLGSLGRLEDIVKQLAGISGEHYPKVDRKTVVIMCADNGVTQENVSSCPKSVTSQVTKNFTKGFTGINIISKHAKSEILVVDIGVDDDIDCKEIINKKIKNGTSNIAKGPAMSREEAIKAIETGIDIIKKLKDDGFNLVGTGEMGIGNTTTSSAIASVLTGMSVERMVGKGAGLSTEGYKNKFDVIKRAIEINKPMKKDPIDVLSKLGGFDIAGLTGCFIGSAAYRMPIVIDGFISAVAAFVAYRIEPKVKDFMFPSHCSAEPGTSVILDELGLEPMLSMKMRLGEGTGAALAFNIFDVAVDLYNNMGTFEDAKIEQYLPLE
ncbi:MAG: nicotinate-nucleotide--dimethylbenzimidazole phosphoribosyltransferase [Clostridia bacterium]|jgi:nicotinate-nucleotide--dimethylbenzimidazole phosphoribosyltransferase